MKRHLITLALLAAAVPSYAGFGLYKAHLDAKLTVVSPAESNVFGFSLFPGVGHGEADGSGTYEAIASWNNGVIAQGIQGNPLPSGLASTNPGEYSQANSQVQTANYIRLGNLTGSGGNTGNARPITVDLRLVMAFDLEARADTFWDAAHAHAQAVVTAFGGILQSEDRVLSVPGPGHQFIQELVVRDFQVTIPGNSTTPVWLSVYGDGHATSNTPVPEPSGLAALAAGLALVLRRRRTG